MVTICVWSRKGGVGKTMLSVHLAAGLSDRGHSVTLIDTDTQRNAMQWITQYQAACTDDERRDAGGVHVVSCSAGGRDGDALARAVAGCLDDDVTVVDCPPSERPVGVAAASDLVVVPVVGRLSVEGAVDIVRGCRHAVIVPNMVRDTAWSASDVRAAAKLGARVLSAIPQSDTVRRAEQIGSLVGDAPYGEGSVVALALESLVEEVADAAGL